MYFKTFQYKLVTTMILGVDYGVNFLKGVVLNNAELAKEVLL